MNFSNNLQYLRRKKNMSQEQLAEELNVTRQSVSKWESGQTYPEMDKLINISKLFGCTLEQLINDDATKFAEENKSGNAIENLIKKISNIINDIAKMLSNKDFKGILKFIVEIAIILLIIWVLKLPFMFLQDIFRHLMQNFGQVGTYISKVGYYLIEIAYIIASFLFFIYAFKTRFLDQNNNKTKEKATKKDYVIENEEIAEEKIESIKKEKTSKDYTLISVVATIILFCLKIFAFFILTFVIMSVIFLACGFVASLILLFQGVGIFGIMLGFFGCLMIVLVFTELLVNFIFSRKSDFKRLFITFCISLVLAGSAVAISALDITKFEIVNDFPKDFELVTEKAEIAMNKNVRLAPNVIEEANEYVIDNSLKDKVIVELTYHKNCRDDKINLINNKIEVDWAIRSVKINRIYKSLISGLKDNKFYNFGNLHEVSVKIYGNEKNIEQLQKYKAIDKKITDEAECENRIADIENRNESATKRYIEDFENANNELMMMTDQYNNLNTKYEEVTAKYNELLEKIENLNE